MVKRKGMEQHLFCHPERAKDLRHTEINEASPSLIYLLRASASAQSSWALPLGNRYFLIQDY